MHTFLVVTLLLAITLHPVAATAPSMNSMLPTDSLGSFYPDPDGMLDTCEFCGLLIGCCAHTLGVHAPRRAPTFTPATFLDHPDWPGDSFPAFDMLSDSEPTTFPPSVFDRQPMQPLLQQFEENATSVQPSTVQSHVEDIYTPGDRVVAAAEPQADPRRPHRRQPPRPRGFPCVNEGCDKMFDRACDLKRHRKTHLDPSERPHKCPVCGEGFLYPKDRSRHEKTHMKSSLAQATLYCPVPNCSNIDGFSRRDNLLRHQRKQHPHLITI